MNDLNLPPRRELPTDVRDRIRTAVDAEPATSPAVRHRAPLTIAAGVAVLVAATLFVVRPSDDLQAGTQPPVPIRSGDLTLTQPDAQTDADLDRCAEVVAASPQAHKYSPRDTWRPVFTVHRDMLDGVPTTVQGTGEPDFKLVKVGEVRVVAFRQNDDKPVFCALQTNKPRVQDNWVRLSDPHSEPITLAKNDRADIHVVCWFMPDGILVGVAQGVTAMDVRVMPSASDRENLGRQDSMTPAPLVRDGLFAVEADTIVTGDRVEVVGYSGADDTVVTGERAFAQSIVWPGGASSVGD